MKAVCQKKVPEAIDEELMGEKPKKASVQKTMSSLIMHMQITDLFSEHFQDVIKQNLSNINLNVFLIGYQCD